MTMSRPNHSAMLALEGFLNYHLASNRDHNSIQSGPASRFSRERISSFQGYGAHLGRSGESRVYESHWEVPLRDMRLMVSRGREPSPHYQRMLEAQETLSALGIDLLISKHPEKKDAVLLTLATNRRARVSVIQDALANWWTRSE